jgi:hypothetical protein
MRLAAFLAMEEARPREPHFQLAFDLQFNTPMREKCPSIP